MFVTECLIVNRVLSSVLRHFVFLGGDALLAVLCWHLFMAAMVGLTVLPMHALPLFVAGFWLVLLGTRLVCAKKGKTEWAQGYYCHRPRMWTICCLMLLLSSLMVWVGAYVAEFGLLKLYLPLAWLLMLGGIPLLCKSRQWLCFCTAVAFVIGCVTPACFYSFKYSLFRVLSEPGIWLLGLAFYLFFAERLQDEASGKVALVIKSVTITVALGCCVYGELQLPTIFSGLYMTAATTLSCVWLCILLRTRLSAKVWYAVGWPIMLLPPLPWVVMYLCNGGSIVW